MLQKKASLYRRHFPETTNIVQPVKPFTSVDDNQMETNTEVLDNEDQNKKAKTPGETFQTNFPVARQGSMIPTLSNKLGLFENLENNN